MEKKVYSLNKKGVEDSDLYYEDIKGFTDEVIEKVSFYIDELPMRVYEKHNTTREESILEFLILGVLWNEYGKNAVILKKSPTKILEFLSKLRNKSNKIKPGVDFLRGIMSTAFLIKKDRINVLKPSSHSMNKLIDWLRASGEFNQEVKRLEKCRVYLSQISTKEMIEIIEKSIAFASWFETRSKEALGKYTYNVEKFLKGSHGKHYWHEDVIFCGRGRVEYHLNMVGAEMMNRAFNKEFLNTRYKVLVLPACMCLNLKSGCKTKKTDKGYFCTGCSSRCSVNYLTKMGNQYGFKVLVIPHQSSLSNHNKRDIFLKEDTGVIGVACVLNLISGGWMLRERGVFPQCVLLNYCGCKKHWHKKGVPTNIDNNQLKKILSICIPSG
ncbi:DUF116 domain-containing protein [Herbivorax sp. ANBcel31]|uniref:DUF116 domain-containing protein n=1 Tax=Herbivorax sp. ANBcel31 TaxID=3069754 RepID=UPI0027AED3C0|nr:DUF116 domain-containing protein [Herbivorax sp. ANBcel31]MDQ2086107.1 DUF116 domain-containing protein [Herbivorax sp. ANBcel31]